MGHRFSSALVASFAIACGGDDPGGPTTILVEGQVTSFRSHAAIAGATVNLGNLLTSDFVTTTTGSDGRFSANVEVFECGGVVVLVTLEGYRQRPPFPDVCPGTSRAIQLHPEATLGVISPENPSVQLGETVEFQVRVEYFDGTADDDGDAVWQLAPNSNIQDVSVCGAVPDAGVVRGTTYTAPPAPPPAECGAAPGQAAVLAAPVGADGFGNLDASDTVVVTVSP